MPLSVVVPGSAADVRRRARRPAPRHSWNRRRAFRARAPDGRDGFANSSSSGTSSSGRGRTAPRSMSSKPAECDIRWRTQDRLFETFVGNAQRRRQMIVDRIVEAQLALLDELHERDPDRRLGDRADAEQGVGVGAAIGLEGGGAIAPRHHDAGAVDDREADARDLVAAHRLAHRAVDEGLDRTRSRVGSACAAPIPTTAARAIPKNRRGI